MCIRRFNISITVLFIYLLKIYVILFFPVMNIPNMVFQMQPGDPALAVFHQMEVGMVQICHWIDQI